MDARDRVSRVLFLAWIRPKVERANNSFMFLFLMVFCGFMWIFVDFFGFLWILVVFVGFEDLCVFVEFRVPEIPRLVFDIKAKC